MQCSADLTGNGPSTAVATNGTAGALASLMPRIRIFAERASFELREEDVHALRRQQSGSSAESGGGRSASQVMWDNLAAREQEELARWQAEYPNLLKTFDSFIADAAGKRLAVFLDYDGTLTPIVKNPDRAFMSEQMRSVVRECARLFPTAIISGRGREKVEAFVRLRELFYAGSHGMDIQGPQGQEGGGDEALSFQPAAQFAPVMDRVYASLAARVADINGALVEHNKFCVSVHFRNVEPDSYGAVQAAVEAVLREESQLKASRGRKVFEIRPQVDWDKGCALVHLLSALGLGGARDVVPLYIGDDRTDEDAFRALRTRARPGLGILVSSKVKPTEAAFTLADPAEVLAFLTRLVAWGASPANAWHSARSCTGWRLNAQPLPGAITEWSGPADGPNGRGVTGREDVGEGAEGGRADLQPLESGFAAAAQQGPLSSCGGTTPPLSPRNGGGAGPGHAPAAHFVKAGGESSVSDEMRPLSPSGGGRPPLPRPPSSLTVSADGEGREARDTAAALRHMTLGRTRSGAARAAGTAYALLREQAKEPGGPPPSGSPLSFSQLKRGSGGGAFSTDDASSGDAGSTTPTEVSEAIEPLGFTAGHGPDGPAAHCPRPRAACPQPAALCPRTGHPAT